MAHAATSSRRSHQERRAARGLLAMPLLLFAAATLAAAGYVGYVLWPRWPDIPVALDAPAIPITVAGVAFNVEPAAVRVPVQRRPGAQERVDLSYLWPSLLPPDPARKPTVGSPIDPNERLFVTLTSGETTLPLTERLRTIYPRYFALQTTEGPDGLLLRGFRDATPYRGEDLIYQAGAPEHFLARCTRKGVGNSGTCLFERRIDGADVTVRFPRDWLTDWRAVSSGIERLIARLHPAEK